MSVSWPTMTRWTSARTRLTSSAAVAAPGENAAGCGAITPPRWVATATGIDSSYSSQPGERLVYTACSSLIETERGDRRVDCEALPGAVHVLVRADDREDVAEAEIGASGWDDGSGAAADEDAVEAEIPGAAEEGE